MAETYSDLRQLLLSAIEIQEMTGWPDKMVEDYLGILEQIIGVAETVNVNADELNTFQIPGQVTAYAGFSAPSGWLVCDGSAVSRTTYEDLFNVIGVAYGSGDGSTTFNIPDYRGYFLRGQDNGAGVDPDAASRTDRGDGATGDAVGTKQDDEFERHNHEAKRFNEIVNRITTVSTFTIADTYVGPALDKGGNETRPKNINVLYLIKT